MRADRINYNNNCYVTLNGHIRLLVRCWYIVVFMPNVWRSYDFYDNTAIQVIIYTLHLSEFHDN